MMERYEALEAALALVERPGGWTQKAFCREKLSSRLFTSEEPGFYDTTANSYCALGALGAACGGDQELLEACCSTVNVLSMERYGFPIEDVNDGVDLDGKVRRGVARRRVREILREAIREAKSAAARQVGPSPIVALAAGGSRQ